MSALQQKHARNLTVMLTAGAAIEDLLEMGKAFGLKAVHFDQLAVPPEEEAARKNIANALRTRIHSWTKSTGPVNCWDCRCSAGESYAETFDRDRPAHPADK